jgi:hypothetical protein
MHQKETGSCHSHKNNNDYLHPVTRPFPPLSPSCLDCVWREGENCSILRVTCAENPQSSLPSSSPPPSHAPQSFHYNLHKDDMSVSSILDPDPAI